LPDFTNVVIFHPAGISETVFAMPMAAAIKLAWPAAIVTWVADERLKDLLISVCPSIDEVVEIAPNASARDREALIRKLQPDLLLNLTHEPITGGIKYALASIFGGRKLLEIVAGPQLDVHAVDSYLDALSEVGIEKPASPFPTIFPEALREKMVQPLFEKYGLQFDEPMVGIFPGVGSNIGTKAWLTDGWCYLIANIKANVGARCILLGSEQDAAICKEIADQVDSSCVNLAGQLNLTELSALLKALALVIGSDCGALHLAVAADTPVIGLYGPTKSVERGPYRHDELTIDQSHRCECPGKSMCHHMLPGAGNCMRGIMLGEVMQKVYMVLGTEAEPPQPVRDSSNWFWVPRRELERRGAPAPTSTPRDQGTN
jgi:ADP-heptose:LPS heptosyltransferase